MRKLLNIIVVVLSILIVPVVYLIGELYDMYALRVAAAIIVIPVAFWWGYFGYNMVFKNKKKEEEKPVELLDEDKKKETNEEKKTARKADKFAEVRCSEKDL